MGTYQGDLLGGALFALAHFKALHSTTSHFPSYIFPSKVFGVLLGILTFISSFIKDVMLKDV
jgi:hypothetical protein